MESAQSDCSPRRLEPYNEELEQSPGSETLLDTQGATDTKHSKHRPNTETNSSKHKLAEAVTLMGSGKPSGSMLSYTRWQHKYRRLKTYAKELIYLNAAYCDEVVTTEVEIAKAKQQIRYLASRLSYRQHITEVERQPPAASNIPHVRQGTSYSPRPTGHPTKQNGPNLPRHTPHPIHKHPSSRPSAPNRHGPKHSVSQYYRQSGASFLAASLERKTRKKMAAKTAKREEKPAVKKGQERNTKPSVGRPQRPGDQHTASLSENTFGRGGSEGDVPKEPEQTLLKDWTSPTQALPVVQLEGLAPQSTRMGQPEAVITSDHRDHGASSDVFTGKAAYLSGDGSLFHVKTPMEAENFERSGGTKTSEEAPPQDGYLQGEIMCVQSAGPYVQTTWPGEGVDETSVHRVDPDIHTLDPGVQTAGNDADGGEPGLVSVQTVGLLPPVVSLPSSGDPNSSDAGNISSGFESSPAVIPMDTGSGQMVDLQSGKVFSFHPSALNLIGLHQSVPVLPYGTAEAPSGDITQLVQPHTQQVVHQTPVEVKTPRSSKQARQCKSDSEQGTKRQAGRTRTDRGKNRDTNMEIMSKETDVSRKAITTKGTDGAI